MRPCSYFALFFEGGRCPRTLTSVAITKAAPIVRIVVFEQRYATFGDRAAPRLLQTHQEKSMVGSRHVPPHIREVEILRDQEPPAFLRPAPDLRVGLASQSFLWDRVRIM